MSRNIGERQREKMVVMINGITADQSVRDLSLRMVYVPPALLPSGVVEVEHCIRFVKDNPTKALEIVQLAESIKQAEKLNDALGAVQLLFG